jgi:sulfate adenylyltransferase subunit 1 (EFTu-like GTPase family)
MIKMEKCLGFIHLANIVNKWQLRRMQRAAGSFIVIDEATNNTVAAGMIA